MQALSRLNTIVNCRTAGLTIVLVEDGDWSPESLAGQLIRRHYSILSVRISDLALDLHSIRTAAVILTTKTKWEIERVMNRTDHPPVITTDDFDLGLLDRIEMCLRNAAVGCAHSTRELG
jgi:hypothetical protein